ncbi:MAG: hypothetical protein AAF353_20295 [Pseudomonadota bacterium]
MQHLINRFLRWLLFLWVRVEIFPNEKAPPAMNPDRPVLYLLADRGLSDLLVLNEICHRLAFPDPRSTLPIAALKQYHSVYSVASSNPLINWIRRRKKASSMLSIIQQTYENDPTLNLQIVPVSVFWGRPLARQKNWFQVLFADSWSVVGRIRKLLTILIHGRNTRVIFSEAIDIGKLLALVKTNGSDLQTELMNTLSQQREATG